MLRRWAKSGLSWALHSSGAATGLAALNGARRRPLVVGYHRVVEEVHDGVDATLPGMVVSRRMLEQHLDWIGRRWRFVSLDELARAMEAGEPQGRPLAAVTFDDGYSDVYHNALPLLARKGIPAAVFVVTDLIGTPCLPLYDELYLSLADAYASGRAWHNVARLLLSFNGAMDDRERKIALDGGPFAVTSLLLDRLSQEQVRHALGALEAEGSRGPSLVPELRPLSWEMLAAMRDAGITVGSHTRSHPLLTHEAPQRVREELSGSRRALERRLQVPVRHFAYPDGRWNAEVVAAVSEAGYRQAFTVCPHQDAERPRLTIPRRMFWERSCLDGWGRFSGAVLSCHASGLFDLVSPCFRQHARPGSLVPAPA
jgi:peptidoglycan/xylan/chitin deacetylase (PgdA/CDA1 family)